MRKRFFMPDLYLDTIYDIDLDRLVEMGIKAVLLDIDNTLVTYDDPEPTPPVLAWFSELEKRGIRIAFISNNDEARVSLFNSRLGYFHSSKSGKPSTKYYRRALEHIGTDESHAAVIGDQVFTDIVSGHLLGSYSILVNPIKDKTTLFFRSKRLLEKPILKRYRKKGPKRGV